MTTALRDDPTGAIPFGLDSSDDSDSSSAESDANGEVVESFAERLAGAFERAADNVGLIPHDLEIAGVRIQLELAGRALEPVLLRALAHRVIDCREPGAFDLTVRAWDSASSGVEMPAPDVQPMGFHAGHLPELSDHRFHCALDPHSGGFSCFDRSTATAIWTCPDAVRAQPYECAAPLRSILQAALLEKGLQLAHGAVVGTDHGGALLLGRGGSGKSNTALACLVAGLHYIGDDYVLLDRDEKTAHNVFQTGKLFPDDLHLFPSLQKAVRNSTLNHAGKHVFFVGESSFGEPSSTRGDQVSALEVRVALIARIGTGSRSRVRPARRAEALLALAPNTLIQLPGGGAADLRNLARFLAEVPTCVIELGSDRSEVAKAVARVIEEHAR